MVGVTTNLSVGIHVYKSVNVGPSCPCMKSSVNVAALHLSNMTLLLEFQPDVNNGNNIKHNYKRP